MEEEPNEQKKTKESLALRLKVHLQMEQIDSVRFPQTDRELAEVFGVSRAVITSTRKRAGFPNYYVRASTKFGQLREKYSAMESLLVRHERTEYILEERYSRLLRMVSLWKRRCAMVVYALVVVLAIQLAVSVYACL